MLALASEINTVVVLTRLQWYHQGRLDAKQLERRLWHISTTTFNITMLTKLKCHRFFSFKKDHIAVLMILTGWLSQRSVRNRYLSTSHTATCIMMRKLSFPVRWSVVEYMFGMRSSALFKVHLEVVESVTEEQEHLLAAIRSSLVPISRRHACTCCAAGWCSVWQLHRLYLLHKDADIFTWWEWREQANILLRT